jgi:hypothetical protein
MSYGLAPRPAVDAPQTHFRENGLDAHHQKDAIEPSCQVGSRQDKAAARHKYPSRFSQNLIGVHKMFDDFRDDHCVKIV